MKRLVGIVLAVAMAGCGGAKATPDRARLPEGGDAIVYSDKYGWVGGTDADDRYYSLHTGSRVCVMKDDGPEGDPGRIVRVMPYDGDARDRPVVLNRYSLRAR